MSTWVTENMQLVLADAPSDLAAAAVTGDWVSLKNYAHCAIVLLKAAGAVGEAPTITVRQAQDVSGTGAKNLTAVTRVDTKSAADITTIGQFTKTTQAAAATYTPAAGNTEAIYVIEFDSDQLDINNGFDCIQANIADVGATAQIGALLYILTDCRYAGQFPPSAIVD
jgi:hypothetical protein